MDRYRERLIAHLEEEISLLKEADFPIEKLYRRRDFCFGRDYYRMRELQEQVHQLSKQVGELANRRTKCALSYKSKNYEGVMELLTGLPNRIKQERKYLDRQLHGAESLTIADPYFFSWSGPNKIFDKESKYTDFILQLIPLSVKYLEVFHLPGPNSRIFSKFNKMISSRKIKVRFVETNEIHDRVFIKNDCDAVLLGTSLGGYGNKLAFILPIPEEDLTVFSNELKRIKNA
ncbi:hypothetical protein [Pseudoalteromonas sp. Xi13]|uniref:hypothetical protein n=1 Tax=Pseudoalteromonas sp. Xi13 TaxID=2490635 RepID=UPI000F765735|nr:hypothetical protein [Pseudoalteromonas sp. Xi13]AZN32759.1 hypothetical protein EJ103_08470 [Pseudoalteromonas sp. Xi13]